jgi:hypothetical protein
MKDANHYLVEGDLMLPNVISKAHNLLIQCMIGVNLFLTRRAQTDSSSEIA